jgi:NAD(P)-dependent dehydrogenase (short-subunit alcohol dehydrogenase family)
VRQALDKAAARWGRLDIVFANAGIAGVWAPLEDMQPGEWEKTLRTNLEGAFLTLHFAIPHLKTSGGSIIVTSSVSGNRTFGQPGAPPTAPVKPVWWRSLKWPRWNWRVMGFG